MRLDELIYDIEQLGYIPELTALSGIPQDIQNHPEGDAYTHTILVTLVADEIADREDLNDFERQILVNAALTHDLGKATTTVIHPDGRITAYDHPKAGVEPANTMLTRLGVDSAIIERTLPLVEHHMDWVGYFTPEITPRAIMRLARRVHPSTIYLWSLLVEADMSGRPPLPKGLPRKAADMVDLARELGVYHGI